MFLFQSRASRSPRAHQTLQGVGVAGSLYRYKGSIRDEYRYTILSPYNGAMPPLTALNRLTGAGRDAQRKISPNNLPYPPDSGSTDRRGSKL